MALIALYLQQNRLYIKFNKTTPLPDYISKHFRANIDKNECVHSVYVQLSLTVPIVSLMICHSAFSVNNVQYFIIILVTRGLT